MSKNKKDLDLIIYCLMVVCFIGFIFVFVILIFTIEGLTERIEYLEYQLMHLGRL